MLEVNKLKIEHETSGDLLDRQKEIEEKFKALGN
jgi:hypothetical protein